MSSSASVYNGPHTPRISLEEFTTPQAVQGELNRLAARVDAALQAFRALPGPVAYGSLQYVAWEARINSDMTLAYQLYVTSRRRFQRQIALPGILISTLEEANEKRENEPPNDIADLLAIRYDDPRALRNKAYNAAFAVTPPVAELGSNQWWIETQSTAPHALPRPTASTSAPTESSRFAQTAWFKSLLENNHPTTAPVPVAGAVAAASTATPPVAATVAPAGPSAVGGPVVDTAASQGTSHVVAPTASAVATLVAVPTAYARTSSPIAPTATPAATVVAPMAAPVASPTVDQIMPTQKRERSRSAHTVPETNSDDDASTAAPSRKHRKIAVSETENPGKSRSGRGKGGIKSAKYVVDSEEDDKQDGSGKVGEEEEEDDDDEYVNVDAAAQVAIESVAPCTECLAGNKKACMIAVDHNNKCMRCITNKKKCSIAAPGPVRCLSSKTASKYAQRFQVYAADVIKQTGQAPTHFPLHLLDKNDRIAADKTTKPAKKRRADAIDDDRSTESGSKGGQASNQPGTSSKKTKKGPSTAEPPLKLRLKVPGKKSVAENEVIELSESDTSPAHGTRASKNGPSTRSNTSTRGATSAKATAANVAAGAVPSSGPSSIGRTTSTTRSAIATATVTAAASGSTPSSLGRVAAARDTKPAASSPAASGPAAAGVAATGPAATSAATRDTKPAATDAATTVAAVGEESVKKLDPVVLREMRQRFANTTAYDTLRQAGPAGVGAMKWGMSEGDLKRIEYVAHRYAAGRPVTAEEVSTVHLGLLFLARQFASFAVHADGPVVLREDVNDLKNRINALQGLGLPGDPHDPPVDARLDALRSEFETYRLEQALIVEKLQADLRQAQREANDVDELRRALSIMKAQGGSYRERLEVSNAMPETVRAELNSMALAVEELRVLCAVQDNPPSSDEDF